MESLDPVRFLVELARAAGIEIRETKGAGADTEPGPRSAACRVQGRQWVVLVLADPEAERIAALADALDRADPTWLERHYLPPALRARLETRTRRPASAL